MKPKFTSFNDTHLADVFERPSAGMATLYHLALAIGIPVLFCVFLGSQFLLSAISSLRDFLRHFTKSQSARNTRSGQNTEGKRNARFFKTFYIFLLASTIALIVTVACLLRLSSLPDHDASRKCLKGPFPYTFVTNESSRLRLEGRRFFDWILDWAPLCVTVHTAGK